MAQSEMVQSLLKALDILQLTAESQNGMRLNEIAEAFDMKKTTAHNLIRTLRARGFLEKDSANRFSPGPALQTLASLRSRNSLLTAVAAQIRILSKQYPAATITFSELTPSALYCRFRMSPDRPGELQRPQGNFLSPYVSQTAICLQATSHNAAAFEQNFPFETHGSAFWGTLDKFLEAKRQVQICGYSLLQKTERCIAVAFAVPENFALGFSTDHATSSTLDSLKKSAEEFNRNLPES